MDSQRLILFFVFTMSVFLLYEAWQRDQRPPVAATTSAGVLATPTPGTTPTVPAAGVPPAPSAELTAKPTAPAASVAPAADRGGVIKIETNLYHAEISTTGGDLVNLRLRKHGSTLDKKKEFVLFTRTSDHVYIAQSGLIGGNLPNHQTAYTSAATEYRMADGVATLEVRLEAVGDHKAVKTLRFHRNSYVIDVVHEAANTTTSPLQVFGYFQLVRDMKPPEGDSAMMPTYTGAAVYTEKEKFQKVAFGDIDKGKMP